MTVYSSYFTALFFVDGGPSRVLWLWQGWWPDVGHDASDTNTTTGSGLIRWHSERRAAMNTIDEYRHMKYKNRSHSMKLVWAGHEPDDFISLFPSWEIKDQIKILNEKVFKNFQLASIHLNINDSIDYP